MNSKALSASTLVALFTISSAISVAQIDIGSMMQQHMNGDVKIVEDTDPFVPNEFTGSFTMELHSFEGGIEKQESPINIHITTGTEKSLIRMENTKIPNEFRLLMDNKEKYQYMLLTDQNGKKIAFKNKKMKFVMSDSATTKTPDFKVTKETKTIDGHVCTKVIGKSEDGTWTGWVAKDIDVPLSDMMRNARDPASQEMAKKMMGINGFPLEFEWVDAKDPKRMVGNIRNLKLGPVDESAFSIADYEVMEMPMLPFGR